MTTLSLICILRLLNKLNRSLKERDTILIANKLSDTIMTKDLSK